MSAKSSMSWKLRSGTDRLPTVNPMERAMFDQQRSKETRHDVRILIVDDHPTVRESLRFVFTAAGIEQIMEATTCQQAIDAVREGDVDLVLLDVALRDKNGLNALRDIKSLDASVAVLVHSYHDNPRLLSCCFHLGAAGYVVKGNDKNDLICAVRQAVVGDSVWTAEQLAQIREEKDEFHERDARRSTAVEPPTKLTV